MLFHGGGRRRPEAPTQPLPFSHRLHAGELEISCAYCHTGAARREVAGLPSVEKCLECHRALREPVPSVDRLAESRGGLAWARVYHLPEHVRFDHSAHVGAGVSCAACHGEVETMDRLRPAVRPTMGWCLDCHRRAGVARVPGTPPLFAADAVREREALEAFLDRKGARLDRPSIDCATCHR